MTCADETWLLYSMSCDLVVYRPTMPGEQPLELSRRRVFGHHLDIMAAIQAAADRYRPSRIGVVCTAAGDALHRLVQAFYPAAELVGPDEEAAWLAGRPGSTNGPVFTRAQEARIRELIRAELGPPIFVIPAALGCDADELGREVAEAVRRLGQARREGISFSPPEPNQPATGEDRG